MKIEIRGHGMELTEALKRHTEHRLGLALDHHQANIDQVQVRLSDINGPKGGVDKECHVTAWLRVGHQVINISEQSSDMYASIDTAMDRVKLAVQKQIDKVRETTGHSHARQG